MSIIKLNATRGLENALPAISGANLTGISTKAIQKFGQSTFTGDHSTTSSSYQDAHSLSYTPDNAANALIVIGMIQHLGSRDSGDQIKGAVEMTHNISGSDANFSGHHESDSGMRHYMRYIGGSNNAIGGFYGFVNYVDLQTESYSSGAINFKVRHKRTDAGTSFVGFARITILEVKN